MWRSKSNKSVMFAVTYICKCVPTSVKEQEVLCWWWGGGNGGRAGKKGFAEEVVSGSDLKDE